MYINGITHPNGSLILSPKSPNLKSQSSLYSSLSLSLSKMVRVFFFCWRIWLGFHQYSPYHIACLCFGEKIWYPLSLFLNALERGSKIFSGKWLPDFLGNNNNIFPVRGFPCRRWHGSRGRWCLCQRGRPMGFFVLSYGLDWWVFLCFHVL